MDRTLVLALTPLAPEKDYVPSYFLMLTAKEQKQWGKAWFSYGLLPVLLVTPEYSIVGFI